MQYKFSYFDQSLSKGYVRSVRPDEAGLYDCFVFTGLDRLNIPIVFRFDPQELRCKALPIKKESTGEKFQYFFSHDLNDYVVATSVSRGRARDFPHVPRIDTLELAGIEVRQL